MKRYSISTLRTVNRDTSKTGLQFHCSGRTDNPQEIIDEFTKTQIEITKTLYLGKYTYYHSRNLGIKITDSQTKKTIFCEARVSDADEIAELYKQMHPDEQ